MDSQNLRRIDEIERLDPVWSTDRVLELSNLMETFATGPEELRSLIARYASSPNPFVTQHLACLLAKRAESPRSGILPLLVMFIGRLRRDDHPETLMNTMTALLHAFHYFEMDQLTTDSRHALFSFTMHGLNYTQTHAVIIQGQALALISVLKHRRWLEGVFDPDQIAHLRKKVSELWQSSGETLVDELTALTDFIEQ